jgi:probable biosynthetic protein (TIGR04099 family)
MNSLIRSIELKDLELKDLELKDLELKDLEPKHQELKHLPKRSATASEMPAGIVLGMPHLCLAGLSETWLLKECGHRHWLLLAEAADIDRPEFRDETGEPIYATFLAVSVRDAAFDAVREHDELVFSSRLARISRTQFTSFHRLSIGARPIGEIALTSTFVRRAQRGRNHSIVRAEVSGLPPIGIEPRAFTFAAQSAALRAGRWATHLGFERRKAAVIDRFIVDPCPGQDFNGADLLYFASFQAFVDRAEWSFFRPDAPFPTTRRRDIIYRGNIDPGERVVASLLQFRRHGETLGHWYSLERDRDSAAIADIFTVRGLPATP